MPSLQSTSPLDLHWRILKKITLFKYEGFGIAIDTDLINTGVSHVSFNITTSNFLPIKKPSNVHF